MADPFASSLKRLSSLKDVSEEHSFRQDRETATSWKAVYPFIGRIEEAYAAVSVRYGFDFRSTALTS
jgi:hypothetical protein